MGELPAGQGARAGRGGRKREGLGYLDPLPMPPPLRHVVPVCSAGDVSRAARGGAGGRRPRERRRERARGGKAARAAPPPPAALALSPPQSASAAWVRLWGKARSVVCAPAGRPGSEASQSAYGAGLRHPGTTGATPAAVWLIRNPPRGRCSLVCSRARGSPRGA